MVDTATIFTLAGVILGIGFLADLIFQRTGIPDTLILISLGVLVGPIAQIVHRNSLVEITPIFAALAVTVILFEGGLNLHLRRVLSEGTRAITLATVGVLGSVIGTTTFTTYVLGWAPIHGALLGSILGGSSSAVTMPLVRRVSSSEKVTTLLNLESTFTDVIVVVVAITLLQFLDFPSSEVDPSLFAHALASGFSVGAVAGFLGGILWLRLLKTISEDAYRDILTLGFVILLYGVTETIGGNGAMSALIFGLVLGNGEEIAGMLHLKEPVKASRVMKRFQAQISFLIRTFFFTYLGIIFLVDGPSAVMMGIAVSIMLLVIRYIVVWISTSNDPVLQIDRPLMTLLYGRGLATAVMASLVVTYGLKLSAPIQDTTIVVIIVTNTLGLWLIWMYRNRFVGWGRRSFVDMWIRRFIR